MTGWIGSQWLSLLIITVHKATGTAPFYLNKGRHLHALPMDPVSPGDTLADLYIKELQQVMASAEDGLRKAKQAMKERWDKTKKLEIHYEEGDLVLVQSEYLPSTCPVRAPTFEVAVKETRQ
jgi:hypothetical protein